MSSEGIKKTIASIETIVFLYKENHALDAWFNKAYGGE